MRPSPLLILALALAGCGSAPPDDVERTGAVVGGTGPLPGYIQGLRYETDGHAGYTDAQGTFFYRAGATVTFSIGPLEFQPVPGAALIGPFQLANGAGCAVGDALTNVVRVLQTLDEDAFLDDGITLPELPKSAPPVLVAPLDEAGLAAAVAQCRPGATLVDAAPALERFIRQVDDEAWTARDKVVFPFAEAIHRGQGVTTDAASWFFSSSNHLERTTWSFEPEVENKQPIPNDLFLQGTNHIGDIDVLDGVLYAPLEDGPDFPASYIVSYAADSLALTGERWLLPHELTTKGVPWVAVDGPRRRAYTAEWDPTLQLNRFLLDEGFAVLDTLPLDPPIGRIQGAKVYGGALYASSDDDVKSIYKVDLDTGTVLTLFALGTPGTEVEGLAATRESDGMHLHILNVVIPEVEFVDYQRTRAPLRDSLCP